MNIEEIKEFIGIKDAIDIGCGCRLDNEECIELDKFINQQAETIESLKKDAINDK